MKSLDQIEPRKVIDRLPFSIASPGSYVLTANLSRATGNGIEVAVSDVILDLNGFVLTGDPAGGGHGIHVASGVRNVQIRNGVLRSWGDDGIHAPGGSDLRVQDVRVYDCVGDGCAVGAAHVESSVFSDNGGAGLRVQGDPPELKVKIIVKKVAAGGNGGGGITYVGTCDASVEDASIVGNTGHGILVTSAAPADRCRLRLARCEIGNNTGDGLRVSENGPFDQDCDFSDTRFDANGGDGVRLHLTGDESRLSIVHRGGGASRNGGHGFNLQTAGLAANQGFFDLVLQGNGQSGFSEACSSASACRIENVVSQGNTGHGFALAGGKAYAISRCAASGNTAGGLSAAFSQRHPFGRGHVTVLKLSDSDVSGNGGPGVVALDAEAAALFEVVVSESTVGGNEGDGVSVTAERTGSAGSLVWQDSSADGNASNGVRVASGVGADGVRVTMIGGSCGNNALAGVLLADSGVKPGAVLRVSACGNGGHGIDSAGEGIALTGNLAFGNTGAGIRVTGSGHDLAGNQCRANAVGIELVGGGNAVRENALSGPTQTPIVDGGGNARAPTQAITTGTNPLGNLAF